MKRSYKYRLVCSACWHFELLPNNSNSQYVGRSGSYSTRDEAVAAMDRFKQFLSNKNAVDYEIPPVENKSTPKGKYKGVLAFSADGEQFSTREYCHRYEVKDGIQRILDHFEAHIRTDLEKGGAPK